MTENKEQNSSRGNAEFQKVLEENEALRKELGLVLWASKSATWKWNYATNHLKFYEQKARSLGYEKLELGLCYEEFTDLLHRDDYANVMQAMRDLISGKNDVYDVIYRIKTKNGTYRWFHDKGQISSFQANGEPLLVEGAALDITDEKELRKELENSNNQLEFFFKSNPSAIFIWQKISSVFKLVKANNSAIQITNNKANNFVGKTLNSIYLDMPEMIDKVNECFENRSTIEFENHYFTRHSGKYIWVNYRLAFQEPDFVLVYADVITDKKNTAQALKDSEARSRALLNVIPDLMFRLDHKGIIIDYKAEKNQLYAQYMDDLKGVCITDHLPSEIANKTQYYIQKSLQENNIQYYTYQLDVPDTGLHSYEARMIPSGENEVMAIIRDVTEWENTKNLLKENQVRSKALLDAVPDLMFRLSKEGKYLDYNAPLHKLAIQDQDVIGKSLFDVMPYDVAKESIITIEEALRTNDIQTYEYVINIPNQGMTYFEARIVPCINQEVIALVRDITDYKLLVEELSLAKEKAEESDRLKSAFLTNMSHEIRTPLNALVGFSTLIASKNLKEEKLNKYSNLISKNSKQLLNVINDILDISKIEAGQVELNLFDVKIYNEIDDVVNTIRPILIEKSSPVNLKVDCDQKDIILRADVQRFRQILMNLLSNAIKFTDRGYVKVGYKIVEKDIVFFVKDTGLGIPKDMQEIIFDRFKQVRREDGKFFGGTGLGLPIAKSYTELMGGKMWMESEPRRGTTFYFTLPIS